MLKTDFFGARQFRLALAFALAISAATVGAFGFIYLQVAGADIARVGAILTEEARRNVDASRERLAAALEARQTQHIRRIDYLALFDSSGARVLGNIPTLPSIPLDGRAHVVDGREIAAPESAIFVGERRADGGALLMGRNLQDTYDIEDTLLRALAITLAPTVVLILGIGVLFARRATLRFSTIQDSIQRIMQGEMRLRLPVSRESDEIDRIARAVNLMLDEIARLLDQLRSVADNIAHDLRTPLTVVRRKVEVALDAQALPAAAREPLDVALSQLDRAAVTITALLRISAVESGARNKGFRDVNLANVCAEACDFYAPLAEAKSVALTATLETPVWMRGDEDLLREALSNLLDNAIKFTPAGGAVRVDAKFVDGRPCLEVRDTGPGVEVGDREKIFRRFFRSAIGIREGGHGLGLSIAQTVAELHGFTLSVEDNQPGARFIMRASDKARARAVR
jgi:signal transduction histidine kinase